MTLLNKLQTKIIRTNFHVTHNNILFKAMLLNFVHHLSSSYKKTERVLSVH